MSSSLYGSRGPTGGMASTRTGNPGKVGGYNVQQMQQFTPEQMDLFKQLFGNVGPDSYLSRLAGGDEALFNEMEAPALKQFAGLQGNLASRFSGMGTGARRSSGFQNTSNQAAQDFTGQLQSRRQELMRQALKDMHGMSQDLLNQRPYETFLTPEKPSFLESLLGALGGGAAQFAGGLGGAYGFRKLLGA